jgi:hypothetical protein
MDSDATAILALGDLTGGTVIGAQLDNVGLSEISECRP